MATAQAAHIPPQNLEAEESVLGAMMVSEGSITPVILDVRLRAEDFYRDRHRTIYEAIRVLYERSEPIDALTVAEFLTQRGELDDAGGKDNLQTLASTVPAPGNARHYAQIVKQNALLRRLLGAAQTIQQSVHERDGEPEALVEDAERLLFRVAHEDRASDFRNMGEILEQEIDRLEQLAQGDNELTGVGSGFIDLDKVTGGFQPGNLIVIAARPAMGKCLVGSSLIFDPGTGVRRRMDEIVEAGERGERIRVAATGADLKLRSVEVSDFHRNGVRPVFRLTTKLGRRVTATANHPLLTIKGWKPLCDLEPGDRIAVPRNLPRDADAKSMPDEEIVMLAALIADGNLTQRTPRFCWGADSPIINDVRAAADKLGVRLRVGGGAEHGTATISAGRGASSNPVTELCKRHGLWGKSSGEKFVPDAIFELSHNKVARFLSVLYACDGHIYATDRLRQIGYSTNSDRLAKDVQHLLLRLGIVAAIRTLKRGVYEGTGKVAREVRITARDSLVEFCARIDVPGKAEQTQRVRLTLPRSKRDTNVDTIPAGVWEQITLAKGDRSWAELSRAAQRPDSHNWHVGTRGLSRDLLSEVADWAGDQGLHDLAVSDLWWDQIASIEPAGEEETYDLTVPGDHNFVADDIVVHNSALVTNVAQNVSKDGRPVAFFSLEMSEAELAHRFIAIEAKISSDRLRRGKVSERDWPGVVRACNVLEKAPLWIDDSSDLGLLDLRAKARRLHAETKDLGVIIIDYIQLMRPEDPRQNRVEQVGQMSRGLKILARELNVPVIALSQLSRAPEQRPDKRPILSDLRESGNIEQDADLVAFLYRDEYYDPESESQGEAELIIRKHRNGPIDTIRLAFRPHYPSFTNGSRRDEPAFEQPAGEGPPLDTIPAAEEL